jgi:O-antigen ligase
MTVMSSHRHDPRGWGLLTAGCLVAALAGPLAASSTPLMYAALGAGLIVAAAAFTARVPTAAVVIALSLLVSSLIDIPQHIHIGPTSGQGFESVALVALLALLCLNDGRSSPGGAGIGFLWPIALFVMWTFASFLWGSVTQQGLQNGLVYLGFAEMLLVAATAGRWAPDMTFQVMNAAFGVAAAIGCSLYAASFVIAGHGNRLVVSPRPFGLFGVLVVAWFMAGYVSGSRRAGVVVAITVLLTLVSLSRSALAAQLIVIMLAWIGTTTNFRTVLRAVGVLVGILCVGFAAVMLYAPLHKRFFEGDKHQIGGVAINVTGRDALWSANWHWFTEKPVVGWGVGSSDRMTAALPGAFSAHPHNDYLRLLVDFGVIGLILFVGGYLVLMRMTWKGWRSSLAVGGIDARIQCAAFLGLTGIAVTMLVDNPLIEIAKMAPLGAMVGLALGRAAAGASRPVEQAVHAPPEPVLG